MKKYIKYYITFLIGLLFILLNISLYYYYSIKYGNNFKYTDEYINLFYMWIISVLFWIPILVYWLYNILLIKLKRLFLVMVFVILTLIWIGMVVGLIYLLSINNIKTSQWLFNSIKLIQYFLWYFSFLSITIIITYKYIKNWTSVDEILSDNPTKNLS